MGVSRAVVLLIDLLIIQMVYLLFHYVMDFMRIKLNLWVEITLFISLMITNTLVILHVKMGKPYQEVFVLSVAVYVLLLLGVATYVNLEQFRRYNIIYGWNAGERLLEGVADILIKNVDSKTEICAPHSRKQPAAPLLRVFSVP